MLPKDNAALRTVLTIIVVSILVHLTTNLEWIIYFSLFVGIGSIISTRFLSLVYLYWSRISFFLELVIPQILLLVVFFVILTPLALLQKLQKFLMHSDNFGKKVSFFEEVDRKFTRNSFLKTW